MRLIDALTRCARTLRSAVVSAGRPIVRVVRGAFRAAAPIAVPILAAACSRAEPPPGAVAQTPAATPVVVEVPAETAVDAGVDAATVEKPRRPRSLGRFMITMYYVANEDEIDGPRTIVHPKLDGTAANDQLVAARGDGDRAGSGEVNLASAAPTAPVEDDEPVPTRDLVPVVDRNCKPLAHVSRKFRYQMALQGTGRLRDGRVINVAGRCKCKPCFHVLPAHRQWGMGGSGIPLEPFRSVAVDPAKVRLGTLLYIPALDGLQMPGREPVGGFVHDGCVIAADTGGNIDGAQIDLFVARRAYFNGLVRRSGGIKWLGKVEVLDGKGRCERKGGKVSHKRVGAT